MQTATIIAGPRGVTPEPLEALTECDPGRWEGLDWPTIRKREPDAYARFLASPGRNPHPGGESYQDVHDRVSAALDELLRGHDGRSVLVVAHHVVLRTYLAGLLGLAPDRAREVSIPNGAISTVIREGDDTCILALADTRHLANLEGEPR